MSRDSKFNGTACVRGGAWDEHETNAGAGRKTRQRTLLLSLNTTSHAAALRSACAKSRIVIHSLEVTSDTSWAPPITTLNPL